MYIARTTASLMALTAAVLPWVWHTTAKRKDLKTNFAMLQYEYALEEFQEAHGGLFPGARDIQRLRIALGRAGQNLPARDEWGSEFAYRAWIERQLGGNYVSSFVLISAGADKQFGSASGKILAAATAGDAADVLLSWTNAATQQEITAPKLWYESLKDDVVLRGGLLVTRHPAESITPGLAPSHVIVIAWLLFGAAVVVFAAGEIMSNRGPADGAPA